MDFKRTDFKEEAIYLYDELLYSLKKENKLELAQILSFPLHGAVVQHMKQRDTPLPFRLYDEVKDAKLLQGTEFEVYR